MTAAPPLPVVPVPTIPQLTDWDKHLGMVVLPSNNGSGAGTTLGEANSSNANEKPAYRVKVPYVLAMGSAEVTYAQWDQCHTEGGCPHKPEDRGWGRKDRPVMNVSWDHIQTYLKWLNAKAGLVMGSNNAYRLPTEAEWEYAARAGSDGEFSLGTNNLSVLSAQSANYDANYQYKNSPKGEYRAKTLPVKSFAANAWGLHDMHGNVWEWVQDCYNPEEYKRRAQTTAWLASDTSDDKSCSNRVLRGGSWFNYPVDLRSADRFRVAPGFRSGYIGFRLTRMLR
jgi:formylglycine-generating enzyme required for sulfatase activity